MKRGCSGWPGSHTVLQALRRRGGCACKRSGSLTMADRRKVGWGRGLRAPGPSQSSQGGRGGHGSRGLADVPPALGIVNVPLPQPGHTSCGTSSGCSGQGSHPEHVESPGGSPMPGVHPQGLIQYRFKSFSTCSQKGHRRKEHHLWSFCLSWFHRVKFSWGSGARCHDGKER